MNDYHFARMEYDSNYLIHHGIIGQRWGIRRFQNPDGSLTEAGKKRYEVQNESNKALKRMNLDKAKKVAKVVGVTAGTALLAYSGYKLATSDIGKAALDNVSRNLKTISERSKENRARVKDAAFAFKLSGPELDAKIGRLEKEAELRTLTYESLTKNADPRKQMYMDIGRKISSTVLTGAGLYGIKALLTKKISPSDAAGYIAPKPKNK